MRIDEELLDLVSVDWLATTQGVSAYDAAYIELAMRRSLTLVSLDARLIAAAKGVGHPVLTDAPEGAN